MVTTCTWYKPEPGFGFDLTNIMQVETDEDEMGYVDGQYYA